MSRHSEIASSQSETLLTDKTQAAESIFETPNTRHSSHHSTIYWFGQWLWDDVLKHFTLNLFLLLLSTITASFSIYYFFHDSPAVQFLIHAGYWLLLGILSSIGLGTGLHTFLLFLGPHVAQITLLQQSMNDFDSSLLAIYSLVAWPSFLWGVGTAIGELPPYFVARAAALAGQQDEESMHLDQLEHIPYKKLHQHPWSTRMQWYLYKGTQTLGFWGILVAAAIPNPLFDLAGLTCGRCLIPFQTFFFATLIGKAFIKATGQTWFVIWLFQKESVDWVLSGVQRYFPQSVHNALRAFLQRQKRQFTAGEQITSPDQPTSMAFLSFAWNLFIALMIGYFVWSIVKSLADGKRQEAMQGRKDTSGTKKEKRRVPPSSPSLLSTGKKKVPRGRGKERGAGKEKSPFKSSGSDRRGRGVETDTGSTSSGGSPQRRSERLRRASLLRVKKA